MQPHQSDFARRFAIVAAYLAAGCWFPGYACAEGIVLLPPLRVGETINLEMTMTRERRIPGQEPNKGSSTTAVRVEVLDVADEKTVIGWTTGKPKIEGERFNKRIAKAVDPLLELAADQTAELVFDEEFTPRSIRNIDELIRLSHKALDLMQTSLADDEATATVIPRVRELFNDPDSAQNIFIQKPGRYFIIYGWELEPNKPRVQEVGLPSPFGEDPLPATVTIELKPYQPDTTHYEVLYKQELDQEGVRDIIRAAMKKFAGDRFKPDQPLPELNIEDKGEFKINRQTGWVDHAVVTRTTTSQQGSQTETFQFHIAD